MQEEIFEITTACEEYIRPINKLLAQLSSSPVSFTMNELQAMVESTASRLFLLRVDGEVVGMITLGSYLAPQGVNIGLRMLWSIRQCAAVLMAADWWNMLLVLPPTRMWNAYAHLQTCPCGRKRSLSFSGFPTKGNECISYGCARQ